LIMNPRHPQDKYFGPDRPLQPGQSSQDRGQARIIGQQFTAAGGMVPTNIQNFLSTQPAPSQFQYDLISQGLVAQSSPYGDWRSVITPETAMLTTPGPAMPQIQPPARGAELQANTPGYGIAAGASKLAQIDLAQYQRVPPPLGEGQAPQPLGMSTGVSMLGSGPQRDVPRSA
jgi:hypothetical protein